MNDIIGFSQRMPDNNPAGSLWLLKLNGGMDCIGEYIQADPPFMRFRALRVIVYEQTSPSSIRIANLAHFLLPAGDVEIDLHDKDIVTLVPCPQRVADIYRTTVSGIQLVGKEIEAIKRKL